MPNWDSPDHLLNLPHAEAIWDQYEATHTELSDEQEARLGDLAVQLGQIEGADPSHIEFMILVEQLLPEYYIKYAEWMEEEPEARRGVPVGLFAMEMMAELAVDVFEHEYELKRHVYALGKLARKSVSQSRQMAKVLWSQSKHSSPESRAHPSQPCGGADEIVTSCLLYTSDAADE